MIGSDRPLTLFSPQLFDLYCLILEHKIVQELGVGPLCIQPYTLLLIPSIPALFGGTIPHRLRPAWPCLFLDPHRDPLMRGAGVAYRSGLSTGSCATQRGKAVATPWGSPLPLLGGTQWRKTSKCFSPSALSLRRILRSCYHWHQSPVVHNGDPHNRLGLPSFLGQTP